MASQSPIVASDQSSGGGGVGALQFKSTIVSLRKSLEGQESRNIQQTQEIAALRGTVDALRTETATLSNGLTSISNLIQQDSALEKQQNAQEAERERRLLETKIRMGKESQLEQKITNSLARPVQALQQKVGNIFVGIGEALKILFTGWLTNQLFETVKAASEGNKKKLEEIKNTVLKGIGDVVKIFAVIQRGFGLVIKSVTGLAGRIGGLVLKLAKAPLNLIRAGLQTVPGLKTLFPKGPNIRTPSPGGGKGPGIFGAVWTTVEAFMNTKNGEYVDAVMAIAGTFGPFRLVKGLMAAGFLADNIAEVFGGNIFGKNPNYEKQAKEIKTEAEKQKKEEKPPATTSKTAAKVEPTAKAQTSLMGDKKDDKSETDPKNMTPGPIPGSAEIKPTSDSTATASSPQTSMLSETKKQDTASTSTPQTSMLSETKKQDTAGTAAPAPTSNPMKSMAPKAADLSLKPGQLVPGQDPSRAMNNEEFAMSKQASAQGNADGLTGKDLEVYVAAAVVNVGTPSTANISSPVPKQTPNVGELAEPKTSVIMAPAAQNQPQKSSSPSLPTNGTNVPLISSSNPDNFYVLYSQLNYNVVV